MDDDYYARIQREQMQREALERAAREAAERNRQLQHATEQQIRNYEDRIRHNNAIDAALGRK